MIRQPRSSGRRRDPTLEILLTLVMVTVAVGAWLDRHPITLSPHPDRMIAAEASTRDATANVLVVLPAVSEAHSFDSLSFDEAWLNTVEREVGVVRTVESSRLTRALLDASDWTIIPRRAASQLDPTQTQFVRTWVEDGGVLILEQPEGPWRNLIGQVMGTQRALETRRITRFDGALSRGEMRADVLEMPFRTTLLPYAPASLTRGRDYQVLLEVDGHPGVVSLHIGGGHVILVLFDYGRLVTQTMQGAPNGDFSLRIAPGPDGELPPPHTSDLIADPALATSHIPYVDLLERNLLYLADLQLPIARLWAYPGDRRGALLVAHSEALYGHASEYMPTWERANDGRSTTFVVPGSMSPEELARIGRLGSDLQLQWIPVWHAAVPARTWGIRSFRPVRRGMPLTEQLAALHTAIHPYGPARATRALRGAWSHSYFDAFRTLDAAGIRLDSSYGPWRRDPASSTPMAGYIFGTGRPYRPIDRNGHRFRVHEMPVSLDASVEGYSSSLLRSLVVDSSEGYHTTIAADWPPGVMAVAPSYDAIDGWQSVFRLASSQDLWIATWSEYADFLERRSASHVQSSFERDARRLLIDARLVASAGSSEHALSLTPSLAFPARFEGRPVERVVVNSAPFPITELALTGDRVLHILALDAGEHRIEIYYGSSLDLLPQFDDQLPQTNRR
jgi:hypothetical protein